LFLPACLQTTIELDPGLSWDDFPVVLLWCEDYFADFGHVELKEGERVRMRFFSPAATSRPFGDARLYGLALRLRHAIAAFACAMRPRRLDVRSIRFRSSDVLCAILSCPYSAQ
jgi:hypothetical protein